MMLKRRFHRSIVKTVGITWLPIAGRPGTSYLLRLEYAACQLFAMAIALAPSKCTTWLHLTRYTRNRFGLLQRRCRVKSDRLAIPGVKKIGRAWRGHCLGQRETSMP